MIDPKSLARKLKSEKNAALFCHLRPDGDSIGSASALAAALEKCGVFCDVYCDDPIPEKFLFIERVKRIRRDFPKDNSGYSALIAIDSADISRLGSFAQAFSAHSNTYNIDHHVSNRFYAVTNYVRDCSSNCENVAALIDALGTETDSETANLLLMGILTDTGNFKHKNVNPSTLYTAGKLVEKGADLNNLSYLMFSAQSRERAALFSSVMGKIRYFLDGRTALVTIRLSDFEKSGAKQWETEGFIDFITGIEGVEVAVCMMESETDKYKVSFRSKVTDVNLVAGVFGGGGHTLASGCMIKDEYESAVDRVVCAVKRFIVE